jgi:two-component system response regulator MtrA
VTRRRILLIEDDEQLGTQIVEHLGGAGMEVLWWRERREPLVEIPRGLSLVVLDLMLPGMSGMEILRAIRKVADVPIMVLSARNDTTDKVRALKLGADDYMTKPFWPEELLERVRARMRRPDLRPDVAIEVGDLRIDLATREVRVAGQIVELTPVELNVLVELSRRPGEAVSRTALVAKALDPDHDGGDRTLDVHVSRLRKKLGEGVTIQTVWGIGYRLAAGRAP